MANFWLVFFSTVQMVDSSSDMPGLARQNSVGPDSSQFLEVLQSVLQHADWRARGSAPAVSKAWHNALLVTENHNDRHWKWMCERLRDEHQFQGGYTTVKNYVREHGRRSREMFVPLAHAPGNAQADFGEAMVVIGGVEQKAHFFALDLPFSDACFVRA